MVSLLSLLYKDEDAGEQTHFRHIDVNIGQIDEDKRGMNIIRDSVSIAGGTERQLYQNPIGHT